MIVILGTAHLASTPGKCSPDGRFKEYKYSREIVQDIKAKLESYGHTVMVDVPEDDIKGMTQNQELSHRVKFVNSLCDRYGAANCVYVSIHVNAAASDGKWHNATGWEAYTTPGKTSSDILATFLYDRAALQENGAALCENNVALHGISAALCNRSVLPVCIVGNKMIDQTKRPKR